MMMITTLLTTSFVTWLWGLGDNLDLYNGKTLISNASGGDNLVITTAWHAWQCVNPVYHMVLPLTGNSKHLIETTYGERK